MNPADRDPGLLEYIEESLRLIVESTRTGQTATAEVLAAIGRAPGGDRQGVLDGMTVRVVRLCGGDEGALRYGPVQKHRPRSTTDAAHSPLTGGQLVPHLGGPSWRAFQTGEVLHAADARVDERLGTRTHQAPPPLPRRAPIGAIVLPVRQAARA